MQIAGHTHVMKNNFVFLWGFEGWGRRQGGGRGRGKWAEQKAPLRDFLKEKRPSKAQCSVCKFFPFIITTRTITHIRVASNNNKKRIQI